MKKGQREKVRTFAPADFEPLGPMFASNPALAIGDSLAIYASTTLNCAKLSLARLNDTQTSKSVKIFIPLSSEHGLDSLEMGREWTVTARR